MFNKGKFNESVIARTIDGEKFRDLNENMKTFVSTMFGVLKPREKIRAKKLEGCTKPDIYVQYKKTKKFISIKSGQSKHIHSENIRSFIGFLRKLGVSETTLKIIVLFHFGDKTYDGTGPIRYDYNEVNEMYGPLIEQANQELNRDKEFLIKFLERAMFQGIDPNTDGVDYIYFGDINDGTIVSKGKIEKFLLNTSKTWMNYRNLHIGPIVLRPSCRYAHKPVEKPERRETIICDWPNFCDDIKKIYRRYGGH